MLADDIARVLPELRLQAEARMTSRATVHRAGGTTTDDDGFEVPGWSTVLPDSPFRLGGSSGAGTSRTVTIGGTEVEIAVRVGHFPHGTTGLRDGDIIEVTAGESAGQWLRVVEATGADQQTALRVPVYEIPQPAGL